MKESLECSKIPRGTKLFCQDSDGDISPVIESFLGAGVNMMHPMEPAAGMDVLEVRKKYEHRLSMQGGIDQHVLRRSKEDIRKELEYKMQPLMQKGGMVFGLDHRIPNGTPLENYRYYVDLGRELLPFHYGLSIIFRPSRRSNISKARSHSARRSWWVISVRTLTCPDSSKNSARRQADQRCPRDPRTTNSL